MSDPRTFQVQEPTMHGPDIKIWQKELKLEFLKMKITCPVILDGKYGPATRAFTASLCKALGMSPSTVMRKGLTPQLRTRIRNRDLTKAEQKKFKDKSTVKYRSALRERYSHVHPRVHRIVTRILEDSWGYHKGVHDGVDIITAPNALIFAPVRAKVIDVRKDGWWGLGAPADANLRSKGDGIVQIEILENVGPFRKGHHLAFGHCEKACVKKGQIVDAGDQLARVGLANAWHIHFMANDGSTTQGRGTFDPRKLIDYAVKYG